MNYDNYREASLALIRNEFGELLFLRYADTGLLGLPGGLIEPKEKPRNAVIREVLEETGIALHRNRLSTLCATEKIVNSFDDRILYLFAYDIKLSDNVSVLVDGEEHIAYEWIDWNSKEADTKLFRPDCLRLFDYPQVRIFACDSTRLGLENTLDFGKHKKKTVGWVLDHEPEYLLWAINKTHLRLKPGIVKLIQPSSFNDLEHNCALSNFDDLSVEEMIDYANVVERTIEKLEPFEYLFTTMGTWITDYVKTHTFTKPHDYELFSRHIRNLALNEREKNDPEFVYPILAINSPGNIIGLVGNGLSNQKFFKLMYGGQGFYNHKYEIVITNKSVILEFSYHVIVLQRYRFKIERFRLDLSLNTTP